LRTSEALGGGQLLEGHAGHQHSGQLIRPGPGQVGAQRVGQVDTQPPLVDRGMHTGRPGPRVVQRRDQQVGQQQHLDTPGAQQVGEDVVLLLRAVHPGDAVEEQLVVVARGEPLQLGTRPVQQNRAQRADLAVDPGGRLPVRDRLGGGKRSGGHAKQGSGSARAALHPRRILRS